jgi:hypothetical protein
MEFNHLDAVADTDHNVAYVTKTANPTNGLVTPEEHPMQKKKKTVG